MEEKQPHVFINPVITRSEGKCNGTEGCLSVPGLFGFVDRPEKITVEYLDETGAQRTLDAEGFFARAICHEVDHLHGILFIDKPEFVEAVEEDEEGIDE
ncbi:Peptide deformylase [bioreactor metagenome]|uniref:Peptide deformylase n=1 Tax=bioreactor metagenome TaxID=1076179 RepID=A0A645HJJ9_9ZZZZ